MSSFDSKEKIIWIAIKIEKKKQYLEGIDFECDWNIKSTFIISVFYMNSTPRLLLYLFIIQNKQVNNFGFNNNWSVFFLNDSH